METWDLTLRSCCGGFPWTFMTKKLCYFHGTRKKWLKSYICPRLISSYSVPIIIIHNNNKVQVYMHIYWNRLLALFFFFCTEEWLRPLLRQDKQVLVHWWYYPDRWVFNCLKVRLQCQRAKEVVSNTLRLVDFAIGLVNSFFLTCPTGKWFFWRNSNYRRTVINPARRFFQASWNDFQASKCYSPVVTACPNGKL